MTKINKKPNKIQESNKKNPFMLYLLTGGIAGFVNGLFGGGGGMIVVPMLIKLLKYSEREAHATAILIILPLSLLSGLFYASFGCVNFSILIPAGLGVIGGGVFGAYALNKLSSKWVTIIFSAVMLFAGVKMIFFIL